jgi:deoxyhypusine synthase
MYRAVEYGHMPTVELEESTIKRLDDLCVEDESYDEIVTELINIYQAEELTLFHGGDEY